MKLIINSDDFGLTVNVSKAIIEELKEGVITTTSAMSVAEAFKESAKTALDNGITHMGLHTTLTILRPLLPTSVVPSLVNEEGKFFTPKELYERDVNIEEARAELEKQIEVFLSTGLKLDHIDSHHGLMQKNEEFTKMYLDLAEKYNVPLRNEFCRYQTPYTEYALREIRKRKIPVTDYLYGNHDLPDGAYLQLKDFLKEAEEKYDTVEYFCHVGYSDDELRSISSLNDLREVEYHFMRSQRVIDLYKEHNIELIGYDELT